MFMTLFLLLLLTFSFRFIETLLQGNHKKYTIYFWGVFVLILSLFIKDTYVFQLPENFTTVMIPFFILLVVSVFFAGFSGLRPESTYDRIAFVIAYPLFEEMAFRGILLANLDQYPLLATAIQVPLFTNISLAIVISAVVFALYLQFYKACWRYPGMILSTFIYGLLLGLIAEGTQSFLLPLLLHLIANAAGTFFPGKYRKEQQV